MKLSSIQLQNLFGLLIIGLQLVTVFGGSRFSSHVTVNTPARSYSHGVGDPIPSNGRRAYRPQKPPFRVGKHQMVHTDRVGGYPKEKPSIPFNTEDRLRNNPYSSWLLNSLQETPIPVLPPSPYKVDSPDPESLWPEGLFLPPLRPHVFSAARRADATSDSVPLDPYLLEGTEARLAVTRAQDHGIYWFHDIPHIESLLANQQLRIANNLKPHRIGSIRHTWPFNRP